MFKEKLVMELVELIPEEYKDKVEITLPPNPQFGDYSTNIALKLAKPYKQNPLEVANSLKPVLSKLPFLEKIEVVTPGYLNFFLKREILEENLAMILKEKNAYGRGKIFSGKTVMVEFAHPNPFKIMHIGHLRNITLGESLVRLFEFADAKVIRTNYQGDVGMHVAKCLWAFSKIPQSDFPTKTSERVNLLGKCYAEGAKAFEESSQAKVEIERINSQVYDQNNPTITKLWKLGVSWSLDKFHELYERVDSRFDREYLESEVLDLGKSQVEKAISQKILEKSEGAIVFKGEKYGLDTRVFLNSLGYLTYEGKELGLAVKEFTDFGKLDLCVHNVAVEQISFFRVTFKVEELLDPKLYDHKQYHNAYEFVGLKSGKMSSRKGEIVTAESILDEAHSRIAQIVRKNQSKLSDKEIDSIAVGAVKYGYLKMSPFKYLAFDLDQSVNFSGDSGPYLQYTYARCLSILKKSEGTQSTVKKETNSEEELILKKLNQFQGVCENALNNYSPHYIAVYLNELAQLFNNFYVKHQVKGNAFRMDLTEGVAQVLKNGLYLLGIKTLERM